MNKLKNERMSPNPLEEWQIRGCPKADQMLRDHTKQLIADAKGPDDHAELMEKGQIFIRKFMAP